MLPGVRRWLVGRDLSKKKEAALRVVWSRAQEKRGREQRVQGARSFAGKSLLRQASALLPLALGEAFLPSV